ncbi:MAG: hypothetical protein HKO82_02755 [Acidimicrobiia bacterium]|nr:hypothetical protein [Acidimicrobiia bacterium]NNF88870.1 hypothetical protein [Acidimicrobiia bacterium]NNL12589.1 hypothetical protein [Acidimicrobiia bacterium]
MRNQLMAFITTLGEAATEVQKRRQVRQDWRTEEWVDRFDSRQWTHITGEIPRIQPQG